MKRKKTVRKLTASLVRRVGGVKGKSGGKAGVMVKPVPANL